MSTLQANLHDATSRLEQALTATVAAATDWGRGLTQALADTEEAARQHAAELLAADDFLVAIDRPLLPSPAVMRRAIGLRRQLEGFRTELQALREKVGDALLISPDPIDGMAEVVALDQEPDLRTDLRTFCRRACAVLQALQHYAKQEAALILESITTDIGAGD
jgi:hypothetical protein